MRAFNLVTVCLLFLFSVTGMAQKSKEQKSAVEKKAADERKRSFGGHPDPQEANQATDRKVDSVSSDGEARSSSAVNDGIVKPNQDQPKNTANNAPAVIQTTTSEAGSPAILSENNGRGRDGTGNVQRSSYNMAGAKTPVNQSLYRDIPSQKNINTGAPRVRKQEEQPARAISEKNQAVKQVAPTPTENRKSKEKSRRKSKGRS